MQQIFFVWKKLFCNCYFTHVYLFLRRLIVHGCACLIQHIIENNYVQALQVSTAH
jgi:hypothetical protein